MVNMDQCESESWNESHSSRLHCRWL